MTATSTVTSKNQTTLPKVVVEALGVRPSDKLVYEIEDGRIMLRARTGRLADLLNEPPLVPPPKRPPTQAEIDEAIGRHLGDEDARIKRQWHEAQKARRK